MRTGVPSDVAAVCSKQGNQTAQLLRVLACFLSASRKSERVPCMEKSLSTLKSSINDAGTPTRAISTTDKGGFLRKIMSADSFRYLVHMDLCLGNRHLAQAPQK